MLYELLFPLRHEATWLSWLNVLRYLPFRTIAALLTSLFLSFALYPWFIKRLQKRQIGQVIRDDGPKSHFSKAGTPTMGGSLLLIGMVIPTFLWADLSNAFVWVILGVTTGFGAIGFIDDALKLVRKSSQGLRGWFKFGLQIAVAAAGALFLFTWNGFHPDWLAARNVVAFPFAKWSAFGLELPWWIYVAFATFVIVGTSNAVNLTDGLDGLAIGPTMVAGSTYMVMTYLAGTTLKLALGGKILSVQAYLDIPKIEAAGDLAVICRARQRRRGLPVVQRLAQAFMGDVGSLSLGAVLGLLPSDQERASVHRHLRRLLHGDAVEICRSSRSLTGRRVFQMANPPSFELKGWAEPKIIVRFWIIAIMLALIGIGSYKLR